MTRIASIQTAEFVLSCDDLSATQAFFTDDLGFLIESVLPADDPRTVVLSGYGVRLRLERGNGTAAALLRLVCGDPGAVAGGATELVAPNGTCIELVAAESRAVVPPLQPEIVVARLLNGIWRPGRAGMSYRDLIPGRLGGHVVASHIRIPGGGPVLDYVHYHELHYQLIYCRRGEVRVVYEDQGEPFWMRPGDLVLQPPRIRHRVLECSPGLEVIEIGCPAVHRTIRDPELELPTGVCRPEREFDGQRFAHFRGGTDNWQPADARGYETRCLLSVDVSRQRLSVMQLRVADGRPPAHGDPESGALGGSFRWWFVLDGSVEWQCAGRPPERLSAGDALTVPGETPHRLAEPSADCELLEVAVADRVGGQRTRGGAMPG